MSGNVLACVTIQTANGCSSNYCDTINLSEQSGCYASYYAIADSVNVSNYTISFVDNSTPNNTASIVSYTWDFGDSTANSTLQNPVHTYAAPGTYWVCLYISTSSGCVSTSCGQVIVGNPCQLYVNLYSNNPSTIGGNDGFIESNVYGGTPPYVYSWSTGNTTANSYYLTSGMYTLTVADANGCMNSFTAALYDPNDTLSGPIQDTLTTGIIDSCLNFVPSNYYISNVTYDSVSNSVTVVWTFEGGGMTASLTVSYNYSYNGNNVVLLSINCGTKAISTYQSIINVGNTLLVPQYGSDKGLFIYPVPFNDKINVDYISQKSENINVSIMDASGRLIVSKKINSSSGVNSTEINTTQLPSGVYILNIQNSEGVTRKQIVK
jgi:PKD repeat protein